MGGEATERSIGVREWKTMIAATKMAGSKKGARVAREPKTPDKTTYTGRCAIRIRAERKRRGMSVDELRDGMNRHGYSISTSNLYAWERGMVNIDLNAIPAISKALGVSPHDLLPNK